MRTALVIIDMQNCFINQHTKHLITKIENFIRENSFDLIICTEFINNKNTALYRDGYKSCLYGDKESETVSELNRLYDIKFQKDKYTCWSEYFTNMLNYNDIDRLVFVGVDTGCCVLHSVYDAYNNLYDTYVISDLCASTQGEESHKHGIELLKENIINRVITSKEYKDMENLK